MCGLDEPYVALDPAIFKSIFLSMTERSGDYQPISPVAHSPNGQSTTAKIAPTEKSPVKEDLPVGMFIHIRTDDQRYAARLLNETAQRFSSDASECDLLEFRVVKLSAEHQKR